MFTGIFSLLNKLSSDRLALVIPLLLIVLAIVIPNIDHIKDKLGIVTKADLYEKIYQLEKNEITLKNQVQILQVENERLAEELYVNKSILVDYLENLTDLEKDIYDIEEQRKNKLDKLLDEPPLEIPTTTIKADPVPSPSTSKVKEDRISQVNIASIHQAYNTVFGS